MTIPAILVMVAIGWLALGLLIAVPFALQGIRTIDAVAATGKQTDKHTLIHINQPTGHRQFIVSP